MEIKKASALYFSPTGGTKKIAERIAACAYESYEYLDVTVQAAEQSFGPDELVVLAVPVYGGRVPWPVSERLAHVTAQGTPAVIVAVYGNRAFEDALLELRTMAEERGFRVMAAAAFHSPGVRRETPRRRGHEEDRRLCTEGARQAGLRFAREPAHGHRARQSRIPQIRRRADASGSEQVILCEMRPLRRRVSRRGHIQDRPDKDRQRQVHHLHALCCGLPAVRAQSGQGKARRGEAHPRYSCEKNKAPPPGGALFLSMPPASMPPAIPFPRRSQARWCRRGRCAAG